MWNRNSGFKKFCPKVVYNRVIYGKRGQRSPAPKYLDLFGIEVLIRRVDPLTVDDFLSNHAFINAAAASLSLAKKKRKTEESSSKVRQGAQGKVKPFDWKFRPKKQPRIGASGIMEVL